MKRILALVCCLSIFAADAAAEGTAGAQQSVQAEGVTPQGELMIRTAVLPADMNPGGTAFGGWILGQMDIAGGIIGRQRAEGRVVTVGVDKMSFLKPIHAGDAVSIYAEIKGTGRTSITVYLETWAQRDGRGAHEKVGEGTFTYVHVDENGSPKPLP